MAGEIQLNGTTALTESGGVVTLNNVDSATNRTNLGLGTAATSASTDFASSSRTITAGTGLSGGGDLSTNRTINVSFSANESNVKTAINASGSAPIYACRAWVNFRGTSQSGTLNTSGPVTGLYTATVTGATTFTIEYSSTTYTVTTSGNHEVGDGEGVDLTISGTSVTIDTQIRGSGNVSSITDNGGSGGDYTVNFTTALPDANYAVTGISSGDGTNDNRSIGTDRSANTASSCLIYVFQTVSQALADEDQVHVAIFR